jgi:hypothetical protein
MAQVAYLLESISPDLANKATQAAMNVLLKVRHHRECIRLEGWGARRSI